MVVTLIPIGRFARASRLSIKSLRNYDASGLLPAAHVDERSGYRYYRLEQLARADAIRSLRMVGMPLPAITETLRADDPEELLMSHLRALEHQRDELEKKAQQLRRQINTKEFVMSNQVLIKTNQEITAVGYRTSTTYKAIFSDIPAGLGRVIGTLVEANVDPAGAPFTMYHQAPDGDTDGDIAMCVPVGAAGMGEGLDDELAAVTIPEGASASILHRGSYETMGESYATVATWVQEHGHHVVGPIREIYLNSPAEVEEADLLTELLFPIDAEGQF